MSIQSLATPSEGQTDEGSLVRQVEIVRQWVSDLMARLDWRERTPSYRALLAVLHAFRDCLPKDDAVHLGVILPPLVRGLYFEGWRGARGPASARTRRGFLERIHEGVGRDPGIDPDQLARAIFALLINKLPQAESENVRAATPIALHPFWPPSS